MWLASASAPATDAASSPLDAKSCACTPGVSGAKCARAAAAMHHPCNHCKHAALPCDASQGLHTLSRKHDV